MRYPSPHSGFTLLEILVVLVVIGIVLALAGVNFARSDEEILTAEAQRLALLLESARDDAVATGQLIGWSGATGAYHFWRRDAEGKWQALEADDILRDRELGVPVTLAELTINGVKAPTDDRLVFTPSGFNAPFQLILALRNSRMVLAGDLLGRIRLTRPPVSPAG